MKFDLSRLSLYQLVNILKMWNNILARVQNENPNAKDSIRILKKKIQETETCIIRMLLKDGTHKKLKELGM